MPDYDPDELLAMMIECIAENLPGCDADVTELPARVEAPEEEWTTSG